MVSSGEIWFQMAGSLINRNCCLQSFPKGIEGMVQVSPASESLGACVNVCGLVRKWRACTFTRSGGLIFHECYSSCPPPATTHPKKMLFGLNFDPDWLDWFWFASPFNHSLKALVWLSNKPWIFCISFSVFYFWFVCFIPRLCQAGPCLRIKAHNLVMNFLTMDSMANSKIQ